MTSTTRTAIVKTCNHCHRTFTRAQWDKLSYVGRQDDGFEVLELRNCNHGRGGPGGQTLAILLEVKCPKCKGKPQCNCLGY